MRVFVTGATGFVGSHLISFLAGNGCQVVAHARQKCQINVGENIEWVLHSDLGDSSWLREQLEDVDAIVHAAAYAHQTRDTDEKDKLIFEAINVEMTKNIYSAASKSGVEHFVFLSSIGACASSSNLLIDEATEPCPINDYGRSKLMAEKALKDMRELSSTSVTIIRPSVIYGPGNPGNMARLERLIGLNLPLPFARIKNRRSFLYVGNLIDYVLKCLKDKNSKDELFHLADDRALSTPELVKCIANARKVNVVQFNMPIVCLNILGLIGNVIEVISGRSLGVDNYAIERLTGSLFTSSSKAKSKLNWIPKYSIEDGIENTFSKN